MLQWSLIWEGIMVMHRKYFSFKGRLARSHYWVYYVIPLYLLGWVAEGFRADAGWYAWPLLGLIAFLNLSGMTKRLHDLDYSWWLPVTALALTVAGAALAGINERLGWVVGTPGALVLGWVMLAMWAMRGTKGDNQFGADPLEGTKGW
jgi:uncharacterized membrane protein YhaH (DUF805 family)